MSVTAVIPVRAGSTRVKNKNIRPFMDSNLLEIKIEQLKQVPEIDEIIVSTDSPIMFEIAQQKGVTGKRRPVEFCDEKSRTFNEVVHYIAENEVSTEIMMWTPCVCPFVGSKRIRDGLQKYIELVDREKIFDSVVSAVLFKEYIFGETGPVNFSATHHVPSQYLPAWHLIINGFYIASRKNMYEWSYFYGPNPYLFEIDKSESIDIDDEIDFDFAEFLFRRNLNMKNTFSGEGSNRNLRFNLLFSLMMPSREDSEAVA